MKTNQIDRNRRNQFSIIEIAYLSVDRDTDTDTGRGKYSMGVILSIFDRPWRGMFADCRNVPHNWYLPITVSPMWYNSVSKAYAGRQTDRQTFSRAVTQSANPEWKNFNGQQTKVVVPIRHKQTGREARQTYTRMKKKKNGLIKFHPH